MEISNLEYNENSYSFITPVMCEVKSEFGFITISCDKLSIYASGQNVEEAKVDFAEDFDYWYQRLISLNVNEVTNDVSKIRDFMMENVRVA